MSENTKKPNPLMETLTTSFATLILGGAISAICMVLDMLLVA